MSNLVTSRLNALIAPHAPGILSAMLDQSTDCVKLLGIDGTLEYMNRNGRAAMEIADFGQVAGQHLASLWPEPSRGRLGLAIERAAGGEKDRFDGYCPTALGNPRWWDVSVSPVVEQGEVTHILCSSRDVTDRHCLSQERDRLRDSDRKAGQDRIIAGELAHKARNQIAVITALTRLTLRGDPALAEASDRLVARFRHLGLAINALAVDDNSRGQLLAHTVHAVLGEGDGTDGVMIGAVPDLRLSESDVRTMALVLGELQSNALKYGALSQPDGRLVLVFDPVPGGVRMRWKETGLKGVTAPEKLGTGSDLITRMTMGQPKAGQFEWDPDGLYFEMVVNAAPAAPAP